MNKLKILAFAILLAMFYTTIDAAIPHLINYQGRLTDTSGAALNGSYNITYRIYDAENTGNLLWQGTYNNVQVSKGIFSILLGDINDTGYNFQNLAFDKPYWLEIKVGDDSPMTPRQRITSAGYAIRTETADNANTVNNIEVSTTPVANKILPLDGAGKIPMQALPLRIYDSGWFPVNVDVTYTKNHNLNTTKSIISLMFSPNSDGSGFLTLFPDVRHYDEANRNKGGGIVSLSNSQIQIRYIENFFRGRDAGGSEVCYSSGYIRIIMLALE